MGHAVAQLVEALRKKPEVRSLIPDGVIGIFYYLNPSGCTMTCNRNEYQEYPLLCRAGKLATFMCLEILGSSTSWSPKFLPKPTVSLLLHLFFSTNEYKTNRNDFSNHIICSSYYLLASHFIKTTHFTRNVYLPTFVV